VSKGRDLIKSLPELPLAPFEVSGKLGRSSRGPYLTIVPPTRPVPAPPKPVPVPHQAPNSSYQVRTHYSQAIYPRVICVDFSDFFDDLVLDPGVSGGGGGGGTGPGDVVGSRPDLAVLARKERHYKLSAFNGQRFARPFWCTVKYGPWLAIVKETESCITGEPNRWEFFIAEIPEVSMIWYGEWLDQPSLPNLTVIKGDLALHDVDFHCCAGYTFCSNTQSCIPNQVPCNPPIPV
jgi:hypothetical protein